MSQNYLQIIYNGRSSDVFFCVAESTFISLTGLESQQNFETVTVCREYAVFSLFAFLNFKFFDLSA